MEQSSVLGKYYPKYHWLKTLGLMLVLSVGLSFAFCPGCALRSEDFLVTFGYNFCYTTGLWLANGVPSELLNRYVDWTENPLRRFMTTVAVSLLASSVVIFGVTTAFRVGYFHKPLWSISWKAFVVPLGITLVVSLFMHSRSFLLSWREVSVRAQRLEKENAQAQADSLRRQLDPHFLFNSLNALTSLVEENDPARASRFIRQLSQVYRYVLDSQDQEVVTLAEEMKFGEAYLFLQRTRLGEGLQVALPPQPAAALESWLVPPLALQLLLENALKHNATSQRNPLRIRIELNEAARTLLVRNSRQTRRLAEGESRGVGLKNLQARYAFLTPRPVLIEASETEFVVTLPLLELQ
ncbi:histidine kinase [Hymenobacter sp. NST-14]|uniref:sensor histidine kinase n=1 Tax=Hymenobacter piscis TaxID=2839984 RepID=UPI001C017D82|nr:histidine kinase [Hymenobacter piscis]MBT9393683.1 histidine kinase [Hymenobacter piscis]